MSVTGEDSQFSEAPTRQQPELDVVAQTADRCVTCGADLAPDQRYCVECGTRRGRARFDLPTLQSLTAGAGPTAVPPGGAASIPGARTISSGAALLGTVGLLLLALLVGFFIGHGNNHATTSASPKVTINETGGGAASSGTANPADSGATASGSGSGASAGSSASKSKSNSAGKSSAPKGSDATVGGATAKITSKAGLKAAKKQAATKGASTKSLGISSQHEAPATQKVGAKCSAGESGCVNGVYTGNPF